MQVFMNKVFKCMPHTLEINSINVYIRDNIKEHIVLIDGQEAPSYYTANETIYTQLEYIEKLTSENTCLKDKLQQLETEKDSQGDRLCATEKMLNYLYFASMEA